jgi:DinB superfamily
MNTARFFLEQHLRLHAADVAAGGSLADRILGGLTDDQMRLRYGKGTNSLAWLLWHMARTEDVSVNRVVTNGRQVFDEGWARRLGVLRPDIGTGMTDEEVAELGQQLDVAAARAYRSAVGRRTREVVQALAPESWAETVGAEDVNRAQRDGAIGPRAGWLVDFWQNHSRAVRLGTVGITHNAIHLGEAQTLRSVLGLGEGR